MTKAFTEFYLGYCKISLYSPQKIGSLSTWDVVQGPVRKLLHPGVQTQDLENIGDVPNSSYKGS